MGVDWSQPEHVNLASVPQPFHHPNVVSILSKCVQTEKLIVSFNRSELPHLAKPITFPRLEELSMEDVFSSSVLPNIQALCLAKLVLDLDFTKDPLPSHTCVIFPNLVFLRVAIPKVLHTSHVNNGFDKSGLRAFVGFVWSQKSIEVLDLSEVCNPLNACTNRCILHHLGTGSEDEICAASLSAIAHEHQLHGGDFEDLSPKFLPNLRELHLSGDILFVSRNYFKKFEGCLK